MSDLEYLLESLKLYHDAQDAAEVMDIVCDIQELDRLYQQQEWGAVNQLVQDVISKHKTEADEHDKGRQPAQDIHQLASACRYFLVELGKEKIAKKAAEKLTEEALKHLGGN